MLDVPGRHHMEMLPYRVGSTVKRGASDGIPMRHALVDVSREDMERFRPLSLPPTIESFRVVYQFRFDTKSFASVCRVKFRRLTARPSLMVGHDGFTKATPLARFDDGAFLLYIEGRPTTGWTRLVKTAGGHLIPPFEFTPDSWRVSVVGTGPEIRRFLAGLRRQKIRYRVFSIGETGFGETSPLRSLTTKQRAALLAAYRFGYYDTPRRSNATRVAQSLRLSKSTTVEHLRKAEKRVFDDILLS